MGARYEIKGGVFAAETNPNQSIVALQPVEINTSRAFSITLAVQVVRNQLNETYGLAFGADAKKNMYLLVLNNEQQYALIKIMNSKPVFLVPWKSSLLLADNALNVISLKSDKDRWSIYLNGQPATTIAAEKFFETGTGVFQTGFQSIKYDDLLVKEWSPGETFEVGPQEGRFMANVKNQTAADIVKKKNDDLQYRPFGTDTYPVNWKNQELIAMVIKDIPNRFTNINQNQKSEDQ